MNWRRKGLEAEGRVGRVSTNFKQPSDVRLVLYCNCDRLQYGLREGGRVGRISTNFKQSSDVLLLLYCNCYRTAIAIVLLSGLLVMNWPRRVD